MDGDIASAGSRTALPVRAGLALFVLLLGLAVAAYPGGSQADAGAERFSLLRNYWCDLFRGVAPNGVPSERAPLLARFAFLAIAAVLPGFWWRASRRLDGQRNRLAVLACGLASAAGVAVFALVAGDDYGLLHAAITCGTGGLGLVAAALVLRADLPLHRPGSAAHAWGLALVVTASVNIVVYAALLLRGGDSAALPVVQKLATIAVLGWMWTVADHRAAPLG